MFVVVVFLFFHACCAYKPIIMMHGFAISEHAGTAHDWDNIRSWISELHPGTKTFALELFQGVSSTRPMEEQLPVIVQNISDIITSNAALFHNGWIAMGHSQGGLMMRGVVETMKSSLTPKKLFSLAGVQNGYYGLPFAIPIIGKTLPLDVVTDLMYSSVFQKEFSVAGYWKDPLSYTRYNESCQFLPVLNNEKETAFSAMQRSNFESLEEGSSLALSKLFNISTSPLLWKSSRWRCRSLAD